MASLSCSLGMFYSLLSKKTFPEVPQKFIINNKPVFFNKTIKTGKDTSDTRVHKLNTSRAFSSSYLNVIENAIASLASYVKCYESRSFKD